MIITVHTQEQLEDLPDGTLITWLLIPGDPTSEAVAFIRHQDEANNDPDGRPLEPPMIRTTWISPGVWEPQTIDAIGITYPVHVINMAAPDPFQNDLLPTMESYTLERGGTWAREKALEAAARVYQGAGLDSTPVYLGGVVTDLAHRLEEYLDPPEHLPTLMLDVDPEGMKEEEYGPQPCGDPTCLYNCSTCVAAIDSPRLRMSNQTVTDTAAEVARRLKAKGHTAGHLSDAMEAVRGVLEERFQ